MTTQIARFTMAPALLHAAEQEEEGARAVENAVQHLVRAAGRTPDVVLLIELNADREMQMEMFFGFDDEPALRRVVRGIGRRMWRRLRTEWTP